MKMYHIKLIAILVYDLLHMTLHMKYKILPTRISQTNLNVCLSWCCQWPDQLLIHKKNFLKIKH